MREGGGGVSHSGTPTWKIGGQWTLNSAHPGK